MKLKIVTKLKEAFKDKKKILKFIIIAVGISLFLFLGIIGITYGTSVPQFCAVCHIMKPEVATWEASSHSQVQCTACHVDPGLKSALEHKVVATKELYMYVTKKYELPIRMTEDLPDSRCLQCHNLNRKVSASGELNIPHKRHYDNKVSCVKCHAGVAHGKVASSGMTMGGDFKQWNKEKGATLMTVENTLPRMDLCMDCHGRRGVTVACEACHSGNMKPESHQDKNFKINHGRQAKKNIKYCDTCHAFIKAPGVTAQEMPEEDPVAKYLNSMQAETASDNGYVDYAKTNEYCVDCHQKRPPSHDDQWPFEHGREANTDTGSQKCLICHSPRTDVKGTTPTAACSTCHPSIHKEPWRDAHPIPVPPKYAILEPKCLQCHVKEICSTCHGIKEKNTVVLPPAIQSRNSPQKPAESQDDNKPPDNTTTGGVPPDSNAAPQVKVTITPKS